MQNVVREQSKEKTCLLLPGTCHRARKLKVALAVPWKAKEQWRLLNVVLGKKERALCWWSGATRYLRYTLSKLAMRSGLGCKFSSNLPPTKIPPTPTPIFRPFACDFPKGGVYLCSGYSARPAIPSHCLLSGRRVPPLLLKVIKKEPQGRISTVKLIWFILV